MASREWLRRLMPRLKVCRWSQRTQTFCCPKDTGSSSRLQVIWHRWLQLGCPRPPHPSRHLSKGCNQVAGVGVQPQGQCVATPRTMIRPGRTQSKPSREASATPIGARRFTVRPSGRQGTRTPSQRRLQSSGRCRCPPIRQNESALRQLPCGENSNEDNESGIGRGH